MNTNFSTELKSIITEYNQRALVRFDGAEEQREVIWGKYNNIHGKFKKNYKSSMIEWIILHVRSLFTETLLTNYRSSESKLIQFYAKTYKGKIFSLKESIEGSKKNTLERSFYKRVMKVVKKNIRNNKSGKGFLYEVKNSEGVVVGHVIGTIHCSRRINKNIVVTDSMKRAIKNCQTLITETGDNFLLNFMKCSSIDRKIELYAKKHKKKVEGFESVFDQLKLMIKSPEIRKEIFAPSKKIFSKFIQIFNKCTKGIANRIIGLNLSAIFNPHDFDTHHMVERWKEGDEFAMTVSDKQSRDILLKGRNIKWLNGTKKREGLIDKLNHSNSANQICIAVGSAHLFTQFGLIQQLRNEGFTIQRKLGFL